MRAASQAVWAAARLGVVGERLVRWALSACQGPGKLAAAPPQSVANLCWGLSKLGEQARRYVHGRVRGAVCASGRCSSRSGITWVCMTGFSSTFLMQGSPP